QMVMLPARGVHAERANPPSRPAFPQAATPAIARENQSWPSSCAQTAIIPTNSVSDASAAASSTKIRNIADSPIWNIWRTMFLFCSKRKGPPLNAVLKRLKWLTALISRLFRRRFQIKAPAEAGAFRSAVKSLGQVARLVVPDHRATEL